MKDEVYSYIVSSIHLLNQSIKKQDVKNVKLFSYLYNNYIDMDEQLQNKPNIQDIQLISYCIINIDNKIKKLDSKVTLLGDKIDEIIKSIDKFNTENLGQQINNQNAMIYLFDKFGNICLYIYINIKKLFSLFYKNLYNIIFYRKIKKELEEKKQREIELENKKRLEKQKIIKNILNGNK